MILTVRADPDVATLARRALSLTVDVAIGLVALGGAAVAWRREGSHSDLMQTMERLNKATAWPLRVATIAIRNWRSPGRRLAGTRRVDARIGGPVTLRSAVVEQMLKAGLTRLTLPVIARIHQSGEARRDVANRRIEEIRETYAGDRECILEETMRIYREENVSCVPTLLALLANAGLHAVATLLSPRRQTLIERLAGTVVVKEPRR